METKKEILEIVNNSRLRPTQKSIWEIFLEVALEEQALPVLEFIRSDEKNLFWLTENIIDKFWAMKTLDRKMLDEIIEKEKAFLLEQ